MPKETAEQKLLKLIETTDSQSSGSASAPTASAAEIQQTVTSIKSNGLEIPPFVQNLLGMFRGGGANAVSMSPAGFGINELNKVLIVVIIALLAFCVKDFMRGMTFSDRRITFPSYDSVPFSAENLLPSFKDLSEYASAVAQRNIFQPFEEKVVIAAGQPGGAPLVVPAREQLIERVENFRVVGISWLDSAETATVMVEDNKTQVTHFLKTGEKIYDVRVQKIYADQVIFSYEGETFAVSL